MSSTVEPRCTNTVKTNFPIIRADIYPKLILLRLYERIPDKVNEFYRSVGVPINEVILYLFLL